MACTCKIFIGDESERMCQEMGVNIQSVMVDALQEEIHRRAVMRAITKYNTDNGMEVRL